MFSAEDILNLHNLNSPSPDVISIYLPVVSNGDLMASWRQLRRKALPLSPTASDLSQDLEAIENLVLGFNPTGHRALSVFRSRSLDLCRTEGLPQPVPALFRLQSRPYLPPLSNILEQHQRYGVILASESEARFLEVHFNHIIEHSPDPTAAKELGPGRITDKVHRHLQKIADHALTLYRQNKFDRIILGMQSEMRPFFVAHLHSELQNNLIIDAQMDISTTMQNVLANITHAEDESRRVRESVTACRLFDTAKAGGLATLGLPETLRALHAGQIRILLVRQGLARMGRFCPHCGALSLMGRKCVYCWLDTEPVINVVEIMQEQALDNGCQVFQLHNNNWLDRSGGVAAELRFNPPTDANQAPSLSATKPFSASISTTRP